MKWLAVIVTVLAATAVAAFAIYTFGLRDERSSDDEARAAAFAEEIAGDLALGPCNVAGLCKIESLREIAPGVWRGKVVPVDICFDLHLDQFRPNHDEGAFDGVARVNCG